MLSSDSDKDIVEYAKNANRHLMDIEEEYYKVFRELATEQIISKSLVDVIESFHPASSEDASEEPTQKRGETEAVEYVDELPYIEESQDETKVKEVQDEKSY